MTTKKRLVFRKPERLKRQKLIQLLFQKRQSLGAYPLRLFWLEILPELADNDLLTSFKTPLKLAFSVPKKKFKRANKRNRIRRQLKEIYRLEKAKLYDKIAPTGKKIICLCFYAGDAMPTYAELQSKLTYLLTKLSKEICASPKS
jgi:ribonuclease P protein component